MDKHTMSHCKQEEVFLYLSGGMQRSGSTWLYNIIRLTLLASPSIKENLYSGWSGNKIVPEKHILLKIHSFNKNLVNLACFTAYSYRDIRDALASAKRKFNITPSMELCERWIVQHNEWIKKADIVMRYEDMLDNKLPIVNEIIDKLGIKEAISEEIIEQAKKLSHASEGQKKEGKGYNLTNLYHPGHKTDGRHGSWKETLNPKLVSAIESKHYKWLKQYGYE